MSLCTAGTDAEGCEKSLSNFADSGYCGGLVSDKEDVMSLLQAGVVSVSSTNKEIWFM